MLFALALLQRVIFRSQLVPAAPRMLHCPSGDRERMLPPAQGPGPVGMTPYKHLRNIPGWGGPFKLVNTSSLFK